MPSVGVIGNKGKSVAEVFLRLSQGAADCYLITDQVVPADNADLQPVKMDIIVASEACGVLTSIVPTLGMSDYLIVNSDNTDIFPMLSGNKAKLITYGFNSRSCITASSMMDEILQVCIQRAFLGINGEECVPQEFSAQIKHGEDNEDILAAAAAWAVLGTV